MAKIDIKKIYPHVTEILELVVTDTRGLGKVTFKPIVLSEVLKKKFELAEPVALRLSGFQRRTVAWPLRDDAVKLVEPYGKGGKVLLQLAQAAYPGRSLAKLLEDQNS